MLDVLIKVDKVISVMTANCVIRAKSSFFFFRRTTKAARNGLYLLLFFLSLSWLLKVLKLADSATIRAILNMQATI